MIKKLLLFCLIFFGFSSTVFGSTLTGNLISNYDFNDNGFVNDNHGTNTGTLFGPTFYSTGIIDGAYDYDGINDSTTFGSGPVFDFLTGPFSLSLWVNFDNAAAAQQGFISKAFADDLGGFSIAMQSHRLNFITRDSGGTYYATHLGTETLLSNGYYYHIVAIRDGVSMKIYVDNVLYANVTQGGTANLSNGAQFLVGSLRENGARNFFEGKIDEVSVWDRVLTPSEITDLYNSGNGLAYPFDFSVPFSAFLSGFEAFENGFAMYNFIPGAEFWGGDLYFEIETPEDTILTTENYTENNYGFDTTIIVTYPYHQSIGTYTGTALYNFGGTIYNIGSITYDISVSEIPGGYDPELEFQSTFSGSIFDWDTNDDGEISIGEFLWGIPTTVKLIFNSIFGFFENIVSFFRELMKIGSDEVKTFGFFPTTYASTGSDIVGGAVLPETGFLVQIYSFFKWFIIFFLLILTLGIIINLKK